MRIQHNIMAMNAYRNLGMNNSKLSKNLEKLSSGYKINRAGDDAAGLAISEKMRSQIAGLDQAQKNAQSGINMVQTAEGALTEVHDMLNRMVTLTTQAANGTYSETERAKIKAELDSLTSEIDRIATHSNFNGTKLLNGDLAAGKPTGAEIGTVSVGTDDTEACVEIEMTYDSKADEIEVTIGDTTFTGTAETATTEGSTKTFQYKKGDSAETINKNIVAALGEDGKVAIDGTSYTLGANGSKLVLTAENKGVVKKGGSGDDHTVESLTAEMKKAITATSKTNDTTDTETNNTTEVGTKYTGTTAGKAGASAGAATPAQFTLDLAELELADQGTLTIGSKTYTVATSVNAETAASALAEAVAGYDVSHDGTKLIFTQQTAGEVADDFKIQYSGSKSGTVAQTQAYKAGTDKVDPVKGKTTLELTNVDKMGDGDTIAIGDKTFEIVLTDREVADNVALDFKTAGKVTAETLKSALDTALKTSDNQPSAYDVAVGGDSSKVTIQITQKEAADATAGNLEGAVAYAPSAEAGETAELSLAEEATEPETKTEEPVEALTGGMRMHIGSGKHEFIDVTIEDMGSEALGLDKIDITSSDKAEESLDVINAAIEKVSVQRSNLGAIQNRLEHTINNLGVMEENIQDAEANIRDTDIADEMMAYTKNNILIQSAQAMLAQANQVPQGVLQLMG